MEEHITQFLTDDVSRRYYDVEGTAELVDEFGDDIVNVAETGFQEQGLQDIFQSQEQPIDWRIGEVLVECYLEKTAGARFHYRSSRDAKNPNANSTGADLVGFMDANEETLFLFGEVKSSDDPSRPPKVWYGRTGLRQQLEGLKSNYQIRAALIRWLGFKVKDLDNDHAFRKDYSKALKTYYQSKKTKCFLVGTLVRDVDPDEKDLVSRFLLLSHELDSNMHLHLIALYLPFKIKDLPKFLTRRPNNGN